MIPSILRQTATRYVTRVPAIVTRHRFLATVATSPSQETTVTSFFPDEPSKPHVITAVPGPASKRIMAKLNQHQDTRSVFFVAGKRFFF
jgi:4-aminobutyrate aminotransferase/(S)-3-amino-2-methylpropionate transaminase